MRFWGTWFSSCLHAGAPYLEYKIDLTITSKPSHRTFQAVTTETVTISFYTFTAIEVTVTLYRMKNNNTYELTRNSRITTTNSYITISNVVPSDEAQYLITAASAYGQSVNNLTFNLTVEGKSCLICMNSNWY